MRKGSDGLGRETDSQVSYVNANYRFVVNPSGDYRAQSVDPDVVVPWENIMQVVASAESQNASCPICLCDTVAPRMARCGHIFCLPCLLRYMAASEEPDKNAAPKPAGAPEKKARWKKCPICWDSIYLKDTRPVRWFIGQEGTAPREGGDVVLRLMMRKAGSTLSLPKEGGEAPQENIPWHFAAEVMDYARFMKGTKQYMVEQYGAEIANLQRTQKEDALMFGEEGEWTRKAVSAIRTVIDSLDTIDDSAAPLVEEKSEPKPERPKIEFNTDTENVPEMYLHAQQAVTSTASLPRVVSAVEPAKDVEGKTVEDAGKQVEVEVKSDPSEGPSSSSNNHRTHHNHHHQRPTDAPYFFYQALPHYYLSPLDIKILKAEFGDFSAFPATILPRVENVSTGHTVDHELRRRTRYLSHLPSGCEVNFLECDWTDTVSQDVLLQFKTEIDTRRNRKRSKDAREERERVRAEKAEYDERWNTYRTRRRESMSSGVGAGETLSRDDFVPLQSASGSSPPRSGPGFGALSSTSPDQGSGYLSVWGTRLPSDAGDGDHHRHKDDGWTDDWESRLIEEEIMAHEAFDDKYESTSGRAPNTGKSGPKKKGKKKLVTLMTNGGRRGA